MLLAAGADVGQRGVNDYTPLHLAAGQGDLGAVDILLATEPIPTRSRGSTTSTPRSTWPWPEGISRSWNDFAP